MRMCISKTSHLMFARVLQVCFAAIFHALNSFSNFDVYESTASEIVRAWESSARNSLPITLLVRKLSGGVGRRSRGRGRQTDWKQGKCSSRKPVDMKNFLHLFPLRRQHLQLFFEFMDLFPYMHR